ncbi:MAG: DUF5317 domain-containing protein [Actinomycetota bacterium]|nr:DUF5317 domain-containing protein [Actinomycetota bacterium]
MPLSILALLLGGTIGLLLGGNLRHLATWHLRSWWLLVPGVLAQIAADRSTLAGLGTVTLLVGYGCLLVFAWRNVLLVGMGLVAVGLVANLAVIAVDGGMPVHPPAVVRAGIATPARLASVGYGHWHHIESGSDHLSFLDDRLPVGAFHQVLSFGDLLLCVGVTDVVANLVRRPRRRRATWIRPCPSKVSGVGPVGPWSTRP